MSLTVMFGGQLVFLAPKDGSVFRNGRYASILQNKGVCKEVEVVRGSWF